MRLYGQNTEKHILGLFAVGRAARDSLSLQGEDLRRYILGELDVMFSNKATPHYIKHIVQDWSRESYIRGAYLRDHESWRAAATLSEPVAGRSIFAGDAYTSGTRLGKRPRRRASGRKGGEEYCVLRLSAPFRRTLGGSPVCGLLHAHR